MKKVGYKIKDQLDLVIAYLELTKPVHKLSPLAIKVLAHFINVHLTLKPKVLDEELLGKLIFTPEVRGKIMDDLDISKNSLSNTELLLKKAGFISNNKINKAIIPELDNGNLKLYIYIYK